MPFAVVQSVRVCVFMCVFVCVCVCVCLGPHTVSTTTATGGVCHMLLINALLLKMLLLFQRPSFTLPQ